MCGMPRGKAVVDSRSAPREPHDQREQNVRESADADLRRDVDPPAVRPMGDPEPELRRETSAPIPRPFPVDQQRVGAEPLDRCPGRQDGSRATAGLDEPAHQILSFDCARCASSRSRSPSSRAAEHRTSVRVGTCETARRPPGAVRRPPPASLEHHDDATGALVGVVQGRIIVRSRSSPFGIVGGRGWGARPHEEAERILSSST